MPQARVQEITKGIKDKLNNNQTVDDYMNDSISRKELKDAINTLDQT
jgi:hypothetical protein